MNLLGKALGEVREKFRAADAAADASNHNTGPSRPRANDEAAAPTPAPAPTPSPTPAPSQHADCCGEIVGASGKSKFGAGEANQAAVVVANEASAQSAATANSMADVEARTTVLEATRADDNARRETTPDTASDERQIMRHKIIEIGAKQREARGTTLGHKFSHTQAQALVILRMCGAHVSGERCAVGNGLARYELFESAATANSLAASRARRLGALLVVTAGNCLSLARETAATSQGDETP